MKKTEEILSKLLYDACREKAVSIERFPGGVNSVTYKIVSNNRNIYCAKQYIQREGDNRDRLAVEFGGLSFLWENGIKNIPQPITQTKEGYLAIYSFIEGDKLLPEEISLSDIELATQFLGEMHALTLVKEAVEQPVASEACFSLQAYIDHLEWRIKRLKDRSGGEMGEELKTYLEREFIPFFEEVRGFVLDEASKGGLNMNRQLKTEEKTLSPSDFGFHNVLKNAKGELFFVDFEYYGWDDPAKMIADFYLQPAVPVPFKYRKEFFDAVLRCFGEGQELIKRLPLVYLLLSLKWCLIMLNPFLNLSGGKVLERKKYYAGQLGKAQGKLAETKEAFRKGDFLWGS